MTFSAPVTIASGAWLDLRDKDGTFVRLTRDANASFALDEPGTVLTVAVTGPPVEHPGLTGNRTLDVGDLVVVEAAAGVANAAGAWNLPRSGWDRPSEKRVRTIVGATSGLPKAIPEAKVSADAGLDRVTLAAGATGIETGDPFTVYDVTGAGLVSGTYDAAAGATVTSTAFTEGQRLLVVYTDVSAGKLPSATASILVGSPRPTLTRVEGANDTVTLVWNESVTLVGAASLVEVFDKEDRVRVARTQSVQQAGTDRVLVDLDTDLATGTYTVHVGAGLVRDAGQDVNDTLAPVLTTAAAAPTLTVATGPANNATIVTSTATWTGAAADTVGVVTAVERRVDGGAWASTGVTAAVPDDSVAWTLSLPLAEGSHTVEIRAKDDNDAYSAVTTRTITVNAAAPTMTAAVAQIGAKTITVTFSEAVTCPDTVNARAAWSFDDTSAADSDGAGTAVTQAGLATNQCRITFGSPTDFDVATAGTLTYTQPGAVGDRVTDGASTALATATVAVSSA